jgi:hypothetical protein
MATAQTDGRTEDRPEPLSVTTHWSVVLSARHSNTTREGERPRSEEC